MNFFISGYMADTIAFIGVEYVAPHLKVTCAEPKYNDKLFTMNG